MTWTKNNFFWILLPCLLQGGGIYSFSGLSLPQEAKTFSVNFQSEVAALDPGQFQQKLGEKLLQKSTQLKQVEAQGDLQLEGAIKTFKYRSIAPSSIGGKEEASMERLTIEVRMNYIDPYNKEAAFSKKTFSQYADMRAEASKDEKEPELIENIFSKLIKDILDKMASW